MNDSDGYGAIKYSMSVGFYTKQSEVKNGIRYITEAELVEVSLVLNPANSNAVITTSKSNQNIDLSKESDIIELLKKYDVPSDVLERVELLVKNKLSETVQIVNFLNTKEK